MPGLFAVADAPVGEFAAGGGGTHYDEDAASSAAAAATDAANHLRAGQMLEELSAAALFSSDVAVAELLANLSDRLSAVDAVNMSSILVGDATSSVSFVDAVAASWYVLLESTAEIADEPVGVARKMAAAADALAALGLADSRLSALGACAVAMVLEDASIAGWSVEAMSAADITDAALAKLRMLSALDDSAEIADDAAGVVRMSVVSASSAEVGATAASTLSMLADASSAAIIYCTIRIGQTDYSGWVVNTDLRAVTEYRNVPFDSIATLGSHVYAAGPDGIVQLIGDTDRGDPIDAWVRTFLTDFGSQVFKRAPDLFVGVTSTGNMVLKVLTRDPATGAKTEDWYSVVQKQELGPAVGRAKVGRGLKSTWWGLELRNADGADFALHAIEWKPLVLDRRQ